MRILFFTHYFPPESNAPASRVYEMCKRWAGEGWDVTVITCAPNCPMGVMYPGYQNKIKQIEIINGIEVIRVWTFIAANRGTILRSLNYLSYMFSAVFTAIFVKRPDIVIATSPQLFCGYAGMIVSKIRSLPFILEIRDIWPESIIAVNAIKSQPLIDILEKLAMKMCNAAHRIVTVGDGYKDELIKKGLDASAISVVTNGVDRQIFYPRQKNNELIRKYQLQNNFICAYVGTVGMACGLDVVLDTARLLKQKNIDNIKFLIVGDGAAKNDLAQQAVQEQLDNVIFTGMQPKDAVPEYMSIADACLVHLKKSMLFESVLPSKIFEAAAMEKPIILGVRGFAANVIKQANAGIAIEPENPQQLLNALLKLRDDTQLAQSLGKAGAKHATQYYDREKLAKDYMAVVKQIVSAT